MIISASRRTDIPSYYADWFFRRVEEGFFLVRNPRNPHQISRVSLSPDLVDGIIFWTKNPAPMLDRLGELEAYNYYFQFTLTAYGKDVESRVPSKEEVMVPVFRRLSSLIGRERVIWRYDPILFNHTYTPAFHREHFRILADSLGQYTEKCTVSFLDQYKSTVHNMKSLNILPVTYEQQVELLGQFSEIAAENGIYIDTCAEKNDYGSLHIPHARCIDRERLERIGGVRLSVVKDQNQRPECGCFASIDMGEYDTCPNGCLYCYANRSCDKAMENAGRHLSASPLLLGEPGRDDVIREKKVQSWKDRQYSLFD